MELQQQAIEADNKVILAKATKNAANKLEITSDELTKIIGLEPSAINQNIDPASIAGEKALLFIRCYCALHKLVGGNPKHMKHWLKSQTKPFTIEHLWISWPKKG